MRCYQARRRLDKCESAVTDPELLQHLQNCPACARLADAERLLGRVFTTAANEDPLGLPSLEQLKAGVDSRLRLAARTAVGEAGFMEILKQQVRKRSRIGIGLGIAATAFVLLTFIPFAFEQTVGYEVAFAGVDERLALDSDRFGEFLGQLGIEDADFAVSDCDKVCKVKVSNLKSMDEARLLQTAFEHLDNVVVLENVSEMQERTTGSALKVLVHEIGLLGGDECCPDDSLCRIVVERLGDSASCKVMLFNEKMCGSEGNPISIDAGHLCAQTDHAILAKCCPDSATILCDSSKKIECRVVGDCSGGITALRGTCEQIFAETGIDLRTLDGDIDDETLRLLAEKGISVELSEPGDGPRRIAVAVIKPQDDEAVEIIDEADADEFLGKVAETNLPEGYSLSQNYPNPFNPTTTIDYTIPEAGQVTLDIINVNGQIVRHLVDRTAPAGTYSVQWDATSDSGERVASGVYLYRLIAGEFSQTKSMALLK